MVTLRIRQDAPQAGSYPIRLTLQRPGQPDREAEARVQFALTPQEQEDLRRYLEDYLQRPGSFTQVEVSQIEDWMKRRGEELYTKVLAHNMDTQAVWFLAHEQLADLRIEITTGIAEAASIPWELMRDPQSDSAIALRVQSFVRVQSNPNLGFVPVPPADEGRLRLLYVVCRPGGRNDVELRAVANRLLQDLGPDLARFDITALRPPTFEQLQKELTDAKAAGRPFHIVHFDGHGCYEDLSKTTLADWLKAASLIMFGGKKSGKHGYLLFEHPASEQNMRPVSGDELGKLLHDTGVPVLVLNACQSAMHEATGEPEQPPAAANVHDEVRAIGSLAQAVIDQGIPAVLGMRYSVFVVTAAQYIGQLYAALAQGRPFGEAASEGRKHLARNPDRWVTLQSHTLQDWFVPVVYEAMPVHLLPPKAAAPGLQLDRPPLDPAQTNSALRRHVPDTGFVGRDETLLLLDRAFDHRPVVLLHAYAGQGKTATAVEFARWYAQTGGLGPRPVVLFTSFETHTDLTGVLNQIGQVFAPALQASGIEWHALNDHAARRSRVLQVLQQIPVLWIWDNVEPVAGFPAGTESAWTRAEQADLADFLKQVVMAKGTQARILLTSRRDEQAWLGGLPHRVAMPRMRDSDAAGLARSLAKSLGTEKQIPREDIADWQPLLDYCHGNPLTLRVLVGQAIKMGLRGQQPIGDFVAAIRSGEQAIEDADAQQGRDKSLGASLDYGFRHAFKDDELPIIALLHLFQGTVMVEALACMGEGDHALPELKGKTEADLVSVLDRARDTGLLTHLGGTYYTIHPALPWFLRQLFARHYDGQPGHSTATAALRAWVEAIGVLGNCCHDQFNAGNRVVIQFLALEEANLLHARRTARRHSWWDRVISAMRGLRSLYDYQGRRSEWSRLVAEITPDYCTPDDAPIPGREDPYSLVMGYRVRLAKDHDRDLPRAAALQDKLVAWDRQQAAPVLALPTDAPLDPDQRNRIRNLGVSVFTLGQILMEQGSPDCVAAYEETIRYTQRIQDTAAEATAQLDLGHAYLTIPAIRNLDAAEVAYQRSLDLRDPNDALGRSQCIHQIGMVHHARFKGSCRRGEPAETVLKHAQSAEQHYQQALALCPPTALTDLGPMHGQLGNLYAAVGQTERAREHYEKCVQLAEQTGDRYHAGGTRFNMALMYLDAAKRESTPARQRELLDRAQAYAEAALRDFKHYEGRAAKDEADAQQLLARIAEASSVRDRLAPPPPSPPEPESPAGPGPKEPQAAPQESPPPVKKIASLPHHGPTATRPMPAAMGLDSGHAEAAPAPPAAPAKFSQARQFQAQVFMGDPPPPEAPAAKAFVKGQSHTIQAFIGPLNARFLGIPFDERQLPPSATGHTLQVVFVEPTFCPEARVAEIHLPAVGASGLCSFPLSIPADTAADRVQARLLVLFRNRVLLTSRLEGAISSDPAASPARDVKLLPEVTVNPFFLGLDDQPPTGGALVFNHSDAGEPAVTKIVNGEAVRVRLGEAAVREATDQINGKLAASDWGAETFQSLTAPKTLDLLRFLARHGSMLYEAVITDHPVDKQLLESARLQIIAARPESRLPVEFFYQCPSPLGTAKLCPQAAQALADGNCAACPSPPSHELLCPLGFWGLSRVLEWQLYSAENPADLSGDDFQIAQERARRRTLPPLDSGLVAVSKNVDAAVKDSAAKLETAARSALATVAVVTTWPEWTSEVTALGPALLLLIPHTACDSAQIVTLEIGGQELATDQIDPGYVHPQANPTFPLVLLLGCETGVKGIALERIVAKFRRCGASIIVSTTAPVLGRQAALVAARFLKKLKALSANSGATFGDVMLAVRRELLAEGLPVILAVSAYGDADWRFQ